MTDHFDAAFTVVVGAEGGFTDDARDPGNWTGGKVGHGACHGTNWGISAAACPDTDIRALTRAEAGHIYRERYWARLGCDGLPAPLALLVFDAAVNNGPDRAARWLQDVLGAPADGVIGPGTLARVAGFAGRGAALCGEYMARRTDYMARLPGWQIWGLGWARRLCALPFHAMQMED